MTSNPTPAYVARVGAVFLNNGSGVKGDLKAVIKAVLLDTEARTASAAAVTGYGKLREPILRFTGWARGLRRHLGEQRLGDRRHLGSGHQARAEPAAVAVGLQLLPTRLRAAEHGLRCQLAHGARVPDHQLSRRWSATSTTCSARWPVSAVGDVVADYSTLTSVADNGAALLAEINTVLAAGRISDATLAPLAAAVQSMASGTATTRANRVYAALVLALAAPEFLAQK